jgi:hypothetical protein
MNSINGSTLHEKDRDGSTPEKAIIVHSVEEEYAWIRNHCSGFLLTMQLLKKINWQPYDVLILHDENGRERTVYFDISSFY